MPVPIKAHLAGLAALQKTFGAMEARYFRKATRKGVGAATKLVLAAAKAGVPQRTGMLRKSLGRKVVASKAGKGYVGIVGPRKDLSESARAKQQREFEAGLRKKAPGKAKFRKVVKYEGREITVNPVNYAHLVEHGAGPSVAKGKVLSDGRTAFGKRTKGVPARPFLRPAWDGTKAQCEALILAAMRDALNKAGRK
jgi:HK97 gp10 family phage protein